MLKAAHRFYERNGFVRIDAETLPAYFPRMTADNVFYHLHLTSQDLAGADGALIYKAHGIDFEPKWFPVIYTLHHKPVLSVVELAAEIGYTHPSTISLLKELEKGKLIRSKKDKMDQRKRLLQLSEKGKELVAKIEPIWKIISLAIAELTDTQNNLVKAIEEVEGRLKKESFAERAKGYTAT